MSRRIIALLDANVVGKKSPAAGIIESQLKSTPDDTSKASDAAFRQNLVMRTAEIKKIKKQLISDASDDELVKQMLIPDPAIIMYIPAISTSLFRDLCGSVKLP